MDWRLQLLGALATALVAILSAVTPLLVRAAVRYVETKTKLELSDAQEQALERAAMQAVAWAEEQSRKQMKSNGIPIPSDQKLEQAKAFVRDALARQQHGELLDVTKDHLLRTAVESALSRSRS